MPRNRIISVLLGILCCAGLMSPANSIAKWPTKQLNIIVPFSPGGTTDRIARAAAPFLEKELGVPVVLINRKGGGGIVGTKAHLKNDPADGSYIVFTIEPYLSGAVVKGAFALDDFAYFGINYFSPQGLWVHADSDYTDAGELFTDMKADKKITMSVIPNSWSRAGNALLKERLGTAAKEIPYHGGGNQRMAVIKHDVVCTITEVYGTLASAAEDMKCLAVFSEKRLSDLPDVPTVNEVLEKMDLQPISPLSNFRFYMVKKSMKEQYPKRWEMLTEALKKANLDPEYQKRMKQQKLKIIWIGPEETTERIHEADQVLQKFSQFWK